MTDATNSFDDDENRQFADIDAEAKSWVVALVLTGLLMTLLGIAALHVATTEREANRACFDRSISDGLTLSDAFFQAPPEGGADWRQC